MTNDQIREWLDTEWESALEIETLQSQHADSDIDRLVNSETVSIRYALVTQILGKIADPSRSLMALQLNLGGDGAWDARSFSTAIVVPWVTASYQVLGTSADPYASKPLRRGRLTRDMEHVRAKGEWNRLVDLFQSLDDASPEDLRHAFKRILHALVRRMAAQTLNYPIPLRIGMTQMEAILSDFLSVSSGGLRPLAVTVALFTTIGRAFSLFSRVESQGVNEADAGSGMPGDVMCYDDNEIRLAIEVKDAELTLAHVQASSLKAKQSREKLTNLLFAVPGTDQRDKAEIAALYEREWAVGLNIYTIDLHRLSHSVFVLLDESWRVEFLREIGQELDKRHNSHARKGWYDVLRNRT